VTSLIDFDVDMEHNFSQELRGYLAAVTSVLGIGLESCTVDLDLPVSAYVALDTRLDQFPGRDLALVWNEGQGWAVAVETHRGGDLAVLSYLGGTEIVPEPRQVAKFLAAVLAKDHTVGRHDPPNLREPGDHRELADLFASFAES
jgi:hypothetical protein